MFCRRRVTTPTSWKSVMSIRPYKRIFTKMKLTAIIIFPSKVLEFLLAIGLDFWQVLCFFLFAIRTCIPGCIPGCAPAICSSYHFSVRVSCWPRVPCDIRVPCRIISRWLIPCAIIWAVFNMSAIICVIVSIIHPNSITANTIIINAFAIIGFSLNIGEWRIVHEWHLSTCFKYSERFSTKHRISRIQSWVAIESIARASIWAIIHTWTILKYLSDKGPRAKTNPGFVMIFDKTIIFTGFVKCFTAVKTHIEMLFIILTKTF